MNSVYNANILLAFYKSLTVSFLRKDAIKCITSILYNFFFCQHMAAFLPGKIPVTSVDHPAIDDKIPFTPRWVTIYLDFVQYWIRMLSFLFKTFGRKSYPYAKEFICSMGTLYTFAAEVYKKNLSTTKRPFYIARPRFFVIHLLDPHLMCVPSLHVMVVIHTYTMFKKILIALGENTKYSEQIEEMRQGALAITAAVLFVKQHSVNCIPAALYAMTCYTPELFPKEEAAAFIEQLFSPAPSINEKLKHNSTRPGNAPLINLSDEVVTEIKEHIMSLYNQFLDEGKTAQDWKEPILNFLKTYSC